MRDGRWSLEVSEGYWEEEGDEERLQWRKVNIFQPIGSRTFPIAPSAELHRSPAQQHWRLSPFPLQPVSCNIWLLFFIRNIIKRVPTIFTIDRSWDGFYISFSVPQLPSLITHRLTTSNHFRVIPLTLLPPSIQPPSPPFPPSLFSSLSITAWFCLRKWSVPCRVPRKWQKPLTSSGLYTRVEYVSASWENCEISIFWRKKRKENIRSKCRLVRRFSFPCMSCLPSHSSRCTIWSRMKQMDNQLQWIFKLFKNLNKDFSVVPSFLHLRMPLLNPILPMVPSIRRLFAFVSALQREANEERDNTRLSDRIEYLNDWLIQSCKGLPPLVTQLLSPVTHHQNKEKWPMISLLFENTSTIPRISVDGSSPDSHVSQLPRFR